MLQSCNLFGFLSVLIVTEQKGVTYMNKVLERSAAVLLLLAVSVCMFSGCAYKVKNEDKALKVYTCSTDNMFGLEKVVIFEDRVVVVLDKKAGGSLVSDEYYQGFPSSVILSNLTSYKATIDWDNSIKETAGKYVITTIFEYDENNKKDPEQDVEVIGVCVQDQEIAFNDGNLHLYYSVPGGECSMDYWQDYDLASGTWSEVSSEKILWPLEAGAEE